MEATSARWLGRWEARPSGGGWRMSGATHRDPLVGTEKVTQRLAYTHTGASRGLAGSTSRTSALWGTALVLGNRRGACAGCNWWGGFPPPWGELVRRGGRRVGDAKRCEGERTDCMCQHKQINKAAEMQVDKWKRIGKRRGQEGGYDWWDDSRPAHRPGRALHRPATSDDGAVKDRPVSHCRRCACAGCNWRGFPSPLG